MTPRSAKKSSTKKGFTGFSEAERAAIQNRTRELLAESQGQANRAEGERMIRAVIGKLPEPDRSLAKRIHAIVMKAAPSLMPKTWYGFPAYANAQGKVVCFFQYASKFKYRYSMLGFQDGAHLDGGNLWPVVYAVKKITPLEEKKIAALVKQAVG